MTVVHVVRGIIVALSFIVANISLARGTQRRFSGVERSAVWSLAAYSYAIVVAQLASWNHHLGAGTGAVGLAVCCGVAYVVNVFRDGGLRERPKPLVTETKYQLDD